MDSNALFNYFFQAVNSVVVRYIFDTALPWLLKVSNNLYDPLRSLVQWLANQNQYLAICLSQWSIFTVNNNNDFSNYRNNFYFFILFIFVLKFAVVGVTDDQQDRIVSQLLWFCGLFIFESILDMVSDDSFNLYKLKISKQFLLVFLRNVYLNYSFPEISFLSYSGVMTWWCLAFCATVLRRVWKRVEKSYSGRDVFSFRHAHLFVHPGNASEQLDSIVKSSSSALEPKSRHTRSKGRPPTNLESSPMIPVKIRALAGHVATAASNMYDELKKKNA